MHMSALPDHQSGKRRPARALLGALAALALVALAACTAGAGHRGPAGDGSGSGLELTRVRVGVLPIVDTAVLHRAQFAGYYAAEGLSVELVPVQGGAVGIPQMVAGELDMTWSSWTSVIAAHQRGVADLRALPGASYSAADGTFLMMVHPASGISTPRDLVGKRIAINTFASITELVARSALQTNSIDPNDVSFLEIPFPDMVPALANRQVDAIVVVEPQVVQASTLLGATPILDVASGPTANLPEAGLVTTAEFAAANPNAVAAFERALARARADFDGDRTMVEQTLLAYTKIEPQQTSLLLLGVWPSTLTVTNLQRIADLMTTFGQLPERFDVTPLLPAGAQP
jgi:NitT/TauT family transport system substrate-binding protein